MRRKTPGYFYSQLHEHPRSSSFSSNRIPPLHITAPMSRTPSTSATSSHFQSIFDAAIKAYAKKTKKDLLTHPLAAQLQACNTASDILVILQDKVREFEQSRSTDKRLSRWLDPTINVLYAFSATLGAGVGLVGIQLTCICIHRPYQFADILSRTSDLR